MTEQNKKEPWKIDSRWIIDSDDKPVAEIINHKQAEHAIRCVNAHDKLVQACKRAIEDIRNSCQCAGDFRCHACTTADAIVDALEGQ